MRGLILAAGVGRRLGPITAETTKVLLRFGGKSLLRRHLECLAAGGVADVTVVVGYRSDDVRAELDRMIPPLPVRLVDNARYREGSIVSLWSARDVLECGDEVALMDGDVLYDPRLMRRLLAATGNRFLVDRDLEPGDEPVKLCFRDGRIVDFRKRPTEPHDWHGESVGFFRFTAAVAAELARRTSAYVEDGRTALEYEEPIRDMVLAAPHDLFGAIDVTDLPWLEIDFPEDVERARSSVLPRLQDPVEGRP
jgi:choline kinase